MNIKKRETKRAGKAGKNSPEKTAALPAGFIYFPFSSIILPALIGNGRDFQGRLAKRRGKNRMP
jgi:hypothetical protein